MSNATKLPPCPYCDRGPVPNSPGWSVIDHKNDCILSAIEHVNTINSVHWTDMVEDIQNGLAIRRASESINKVSATRKKDGKWIVWDAHFKHFVNGVLGDTFDEAMINAETAEGS